MRFPVVIALAVLSGCSNVAEDAVRARLIDPDAAKFEDVRPCPARKAMHSGLVNGKNRNGAYAGAMPFFVDGGLVTFVDDYTFHDLIDRCFGNEGAGATAMAVEWLQYVASDGPKSSSADIAR